MFTPMPSVGEDIHHPNRDTFESEWGVINNHVEIIGISQGCPEQNRYDYPN